MSPFEIIILIIIAILLFVLYRLAKKHEPDPVIELKRDVQLNISDTNLIIMSDSVSDYMKFSIDVMGRKAQDDRRWQQGIFAIARTHIELRTYDNDKLLLHVPINSLRGYFYVDRDNKPYQMWIHIEAHGFWYLLKFQFDHVQTRGGFRELKRILDNITDDNVQMGYQLEAPYVHFGSAPAFEIDAYDEVALFGDSVQLFLTPLYLIVMDETGMLLYKIALESILDVELVHEVSDHGIIQLTIDGAYQTFAIKDYQRWIHQLSAASNKVQKAQHQLTESHNTKFNRMTM